jgi:hypothetical protein
VGRFVQVFVAPLAEMPVAVHAHCPEFFSGMVMGASGKTKAQGQNEQKGDEFFHVNAPLVKRWVSFYRK